MSLNRPDVHQKATLVNLDSDWYGTLAEIGAGQETARQLFQVGGAAGTVAKTMSAYDMTFSDAIYGKTSRYVSRERLQQMLDHEYNLLHERLEDQRAAKRFFAYANTVAARSRSRPGPGRGWVGIQFQLKPHDPPSQIIIHIQLHDLENTQQQEALGILGVNLLYAAYALHDQPDEILDSLLDGLGRARVEVDMIRLKGPIGDGLDARLLSLHLVKRGLTDATMFTADGQNVQPAEQLYKKPVLIQRGRFRPITHSVVEMLDQAKLQLKDQFEPGAEPVVINELSQAASRLRETDGEANFLARMEILQKLGRNVLVSNFREHFRVTELLRRYTDQHIGVVLGAATLAKIFDPAYYDDLDGGVLEAMGRMFKHGVHFHVYPYFDTHSDQLVTAENWRPPGVLADLYKYLRNCGAIRSLEAAPHADLATFPHHVREMISTNSPGWEQHVPDAVAEAIRDQRLALAGQA
jgi:hypothetical protein